ncbi:MAG: glycerol-3-phosphate dehydrogenase (NAD(P)+), partial [Saprospiraceae bacterium]
GQGKTLDEIIAGMSEVAEGVKSAKAVMELANQYQVEMPIATEVYKVLYEGNTVFDAFRGLIRRKVGSEAEPG